MLVHGAATAAQPSPVRITIKKTRELAIDGDLKKWRALLPIPQAILTPDAGTGISGPADCSALLRFAHAGANLYVQCSGATIWIGVFVNDNDMPGGDIQNFIAWPSTYGTFNSVDTGALATFE